MVKLTNKDAALADDIDSTLPFFAGKMVPALLLGDCSLNSGNSKNI
jgi:hypothetical protein